MAHAGLAVLSNVTATTGSTTLLAANPGRNAAYVYNDSTTTLNIKFGATASSTSFSLQVAAGGTLVLNDPVVYTGVLTAIWAAGTGAARVTEI